MIRTKCKYCIFLLVTLISSIFVNAQEISIQSYLDTNSILIGDQIKLHFEITQNKDIDIILPFFTDTIVDKVEILEQSNPDTLFLSADVIKISKELLITSFDSGFYVIPAIKIPFVSNNVYDTILSKPLVLGVNTFDIDTVRGIADIKPPINTPITFKETLPWIGWGLLALVIIIFAIWLYLKISKKEVPILKREIPKEPAHTIALRDLDKLKTLKLWQQGKFKEYHSNLTEVLRIYIENRYSIQAMEQTTDEVLDALNESNLMNISSFEKLNDILVTADLVKFAKHQPLPDLNDQALEFAYDIVLKTKLREDLSKKKDEDLPKKKDSNLERHSDNTLNKIESQDENETADKLTSNN